MKEYDAIVIGSGSGQIVVEEALQHGLKTAWVDRGPLGGTCLNTGCIPSKMLIYPADVIAQMQDAQRLGIEAEVKKVHFNTIMDRMRGEVKEGRDHIRAGIVNQKGLDFYEGQCRFVDDYTLEVNGKKIKGGKIFIAAGARPLVPQIKGLDDIDYLTNENILDIDDKPTSLIIIGGGYVAAEYGHFFASMGTEVTIVQRNDRLVPEEEPEISDLLKKAMGRRMEIRTGMEVTEVSRQGSGYTVSAKGKVGAKKFSAEKVMLAVGRKSNADTLGLEKTGVKTNNKGFVLANEYLETSKSNIWALGDVLGKSMFKHVANKEAVIAANNALHDHKVAMDYLTAPHAVFSYPQIASVGLTEADAKEKYEILVGKASYSDIAKGKAMVETEAFAKAIVNKSDRKILGFHIIGPYAPILIQEAINAMTGKQEISSIFGSLHIHPALPELIPTALGRLREPD